MFYRHPTLLWRRIKPSKLQWKVDMNTTITLPQTLFKRLEKISSGSRHTPQSIIKQAIADRLEYEEWKLEQIDAGLADLKAGKGIPHEEFWAKIGTLKNAGKKAA